MCHRAGTFLGPEAAGDLHTLGLLGWLGRNAPQPIGLVDPTDDSPGVVVRQHPSVLVARDPDLWRLVDEWDCGVRRKARRGDTNFDVVALMTMRAAHARERLRAAKRRGSGGDTK